MSGVSTKYIVGLPHQLPRKPQHLPRQPLPIGGIVHHRIRAQQRQPVLGGHALVPRVVDEAVDEVAVVGRHIL